MFLDNTCFPMSTLQPNSYYSEDTRVCFVGWNISVTHEGASEVSVSLRRGSIQRAGIDGIVHLGLENSAKGLMIETVGVNTLAEPSFSGEKIVPWGPFVSPVTLDMGRLVLFEEALAPITAAENAAAASHGAPKETNKTVGETWSRDAGTFYCNEALYRTTNTIRSLQTMAPGSTQRLLPAVFVHLPPQDIAPVETVVAPAIAALGAAILVDQIGSS
jgi:hypothetical protein